jgi:serine/threonine-protein kinase
LREADTTIATDFRPPGATADTVAARPGAKTGGSTGTESPETGDNEWSEPVAKALHGEEVARARGWSAAVFLLTTAALAWLPFLSGTRASRGACAVALSCLLLTSVWVWVRAREEATYTPIVFRVFGYVAATVSLELDYFLGVFSPVTLVVTLGITFFGMGMDRRHALIVPLYAIAGYVVLAALTAADVIPDNGVINARASDLVGELFFIGMAPLVLLLTLWMARVSRRTMAEAMSRAALATRLAGQREAQLVEMQQNLEQLLRAGAGVSGRFTGSAAGRYELAEVIGQGAMGEVYAGRDPTSGERAAIKLLRPEVLIKERMLERFLREGQAAGSVRSPNVVEVFDVGTLDGGDIPYIAMELLHGDDLAAILRSRRVLPADEVVEMLDHVARGLTAAHEAGIVHRDLKPQNLFLHRDDRGSGIWKVLDFGVSKLATSGGTLTQRAVVGTPGYMAPEQARGSDDVDARADLFALGAVAYRAITGRPAFGGMDLPQTLFSIVYSQPPRPSALVDRLPRDVDRVLAIALAKEPTARFQTASKLASNLARAFDGRLDGATRRAGDALIAALPWGSSEGQ